MATWDITAPAGSGQGAAHDVATAITEPGDFDGATIDSVQVISAPTMASDGETDDTAIFRWWIQTDGGTAIFGSNAANAAICDVNWGPSLTESPLTIADDTARSPNPTTAVAADWDEIRSDCTYTANMMGDNETFTWSAFTIRVTYTPATGTEFFQDVDGTLSFVGNMFRRTEISPDGALTFVGGLTTTKLVQQAVEGVLSFVGNLARRAEIFPSGALTFVGDVNRLTSISQAGTLTFAGVLTKETQKLLAGVLSFDGALASIVIFTQSVDGTLTFVGDISKSTFKIADGDLTFSGDMARQINKELTGTLSFTGVINKLVNKSLAGELSFVGNLVAGVLFSQAVTGALSFIGGLATLFIPPVGITIRQMWRSLWSRVWKDPGKKDEDS